MKSDYLRDVLTHPATTCLEAAARLGMSEAAVGAAYRRAQGQGLVRGDAGRPEKFTITDVGKERLRVLDAEAGRSNPQSESSSPSKLQEQLSALQDGFADVVEDVKVLFRFADKHLGLRKESDPAPDDADTVAELLEQVEARDGDIKRLEERLAATSQTLEFYAVELALIDLGNRRLGRYRDALEPQLDPDLVQRVRRLLEVEEALYGEQRAFWGSDEQKIREFQRELSDLRKQLGFTFEPPSLADSTE